MKNKIIKKQDFVLILILLGIGLALYFIFAINATEGVRVAVYVAGERIKDFSLDEDIEYVIETEEGTNRLKIQDKKAYMIEADCKDKICVSHSVIHKEGETIVCLPHKVVVQIENGEEGEVDGISQ